MMFPLPLPTLFFGETVFSFNVSLVVKDNTFSNNAKQSDIKDINYLYPNSRLHIQNKLLSNQYIAKNM